MIRQQTIDGRSATIAYLNADFSPADAGAFHFAKVLFDDGEMILLTVAGGGPANAESGAEASAFNRHRGRKHPPPIADMHGADEAGAWSKHRQSHLAPILVPVDGPNVEIADSTEVPEKLQIVAWAKAIIVLDHSEILVRDLIERELLGSHVMPIARALVVTNRLMRKIKVIRESAIKLAFRLLRDRLGDPTIIGHSFATWAQAFAREDLSKINGVIQTGLAEGIDSTEIARKVVGSMALNGVDGVTEFTRHKIAHLGRVAIRQARERA